MEHIYRAFDGKEFSNEIDCRAHEDELKAIEFEKQLCLWDEDKEVLKLDAELLKDFSRVVYFHCCTEEAYKFVLDINVAEGYAKGLTDAGANITWYWNDDECKWEHLEDKVATLQDEVETLKSMCCKGDIV